jgi:hypothetical protein
MIDTTLCSPERLRTRAMYLGAIKDIGPIIQHNPKASESLNLFRNVLQKVLEEDEPERDNERSTDRLLKMLDMLIGSLVVSFKTGVIKDKTPDPNDRRPLSEDPIRSTLINLDQFVAAMLGRPPRTDILPEGAGDLSHCEWKDHEVETVGLARHPETHETINICSDCARELAPRARQPLELAPNKGLAT